MKMNNRLQEIDTNIKKFVGYNHNLSAEELKEEYPHVYDEFISLQESLAHLTDIYGHSKELDSLKNLLYGTLKI